MEENEAVGSKRKNWAGNYTFTAENIYEPGTVAEIQAFVKQLGQQKAMGSNHCFNDFANSPNNHPDFLELTKKYYPERKFNNHKFSKKYLLK